jgi:hypothetical protein
MLTDRPKNIYATHVPATVKVENTAILTDDPVNATTSSPSFDELKHRVEFGPAPRRPSRTSPRPLDNLEIELAAWEQASDEDLEKFGD